MEARVAAILLAICPLLPMPVMISLPFCEVDSKIREMIFCSLSFGRVCRNDEALSSNAFASSCKIFEAI